MTLVLGVLILVFAIAKNLDHYSAWGSYVGVVLAAAVAVGAWLTFQLRGESLPSMGGAGSRTSTSPAGEPEATDAPANTDSA